MEVDEGENWRIVKRKKVEVVCVLLEAPAPVARRGQAARRLKGFGTSKRYTTLCKYSAREAYGMSVVHDEAFNTALSNMPKDIDFALAG